MIGFLYAGQGSQVVGMGEDIYERYPSVRHFFDNHGLPFDVKDICFHGPLEKLSQTKYTQPCMAAYGMAITTILKEHGFTPDLVAGLSLGEYSALHAAGVLDPQTVFDVLAYRGQKMEEACHKRPGKMVAVLGMSREDLQSCVDEAATEGVVTIANYNCPGQLVIGGEATAVDLAIANAKKKGLRRALPLNVTGAFHTPLMQEVGEDLRHKFTNVAFQTPQVPVVFNILGREKKATEDISELMVQQVYSSVYMEDTLRYMAAQGVETFIEIGPGKALCGFVKKTVPSAKCLAIENVATLQAVIAELEEKHA